MQCTQVWNRFARAAVLAGAASGLMALPAPAQDTGPAAVGVAVVQAENDEVREVRRRIKVMRGAVEVLVKLRKHDLADLVERAIRARELTLERRRDAEANKIRESAPNRGQLAELLAVAAELVADQGDEQQAKSLAALSKTYAHQHLRRQRAGDHERERESAEGLDSLERRVKILNLARSAHAEAGRERNAETLKKTVRYGKRLLEGADLTDRDAADVPSKGNLAELLLVAARLYSEWGQAERQQACLSLAEYYQSQLREERRERGGGEGGREEREHEEREHEEREHRGRDHEEDPPGEHRSDARAGDINELATRIDIVRQARAAWVEAGREKQAAKLAQFLRVAKLQQGGATSDAIGQAFEGLTMGKIIELLQGAHNLWAEWGREYKAARCNQLAEFYAKRERNRRGAGERGRDRGPESERRREQQRREWNLSDRSQRLEVLRMVKAAHAEGREQKNVETMERILHLAELRNARADDERVARASQGLSQSMIMELTSAARDLYVKWGDRHRAELCERLVHYYRERQQGANQTAPRDPIQEVLKRIERMEMELKELKIALRRIKER